MDDDQNPDAQIAKLILTSQKRMVKEEDLRRLYNISNMDKIFEDLNSIFTKLGFELIRTEFQGNTFLVLISEGKDDNLTPIQYGSLALISALSREVNNNIKIEDIKEIFKDQWDIAVKPLVDNDYIRIIDNLEIVKITPIGKVVLKEILPKISLEYLLDILANNNE